MNYEEASNRLASLTAERNKLTERAKALDADIEAAQRDLISSRRLTPILARRVIVADSEAACMDDDCRTALANICAGRHIVVENDKHERLHKLVAALAVMSVKEPQPPAPFPPSAMGMPPIGGNVRHNVERIAALIEQAWGFFNETR